MLAQFHIYLKKGYVIKFFFILIMALANNNIWAEEKYSKEEKEYMLNLARQTLVWYLGYKKIPQPKPEELTENLKENRPCFVTLMKRNYGLRGCIGMFEFDQPLYKNIISRAIAAATEDFRFPYPVSFEELDDIQIEISILTEPKELHFSSPQDLLEKITPHKDGVILYTDYGSSTYLPQVWEQLPNKELFLSSLCQKHGAPANWWKTNYKKLKVEVYHAIHFSEEGFGGKKIVGPYGAVVGKRGAKILGKVSLLKDSAIKKDTFVEEGTYLEEGTIVTEDSDIVEKLDR
ncbi:MAG: AmmeMemoRadiSam system protein A [Candidatus Omnitrophica bacterium]|nr:AmmeMemoRadiSam system protein A [Candidatus Omnitrophota bacterium]